MAVLARGVVVSGLVAVGLLWPGLVAAGTSETLEKQCHVQLKMSDGACACIGQRAEAELNAKQQEMIVAAVLKDQDAVARLRGEMTVDEMTKVGEFMMNVPGECATQSQ